MNGDTFMGWDPHRWPRLVDYLYWKYKTQGDLDALQWAQQLDNDT